MRKLLIAESSEYLRFALKATLQSEYEVYTCSDGNIALEQINRLKPEALIIDFSLSYLDGLTVLQKAYHTPSVILALSGLVNPYVLHAAQELGVSYVIPLPCSVNAVSQRLRELLPCSQLTNIAPNYQTQTENHLQALGFSSHMSGYKFLCLAIPMFLLDPLQSLSKEIYPAVIESLGYTGEWQTIERAIRTAIHAAWQHRDPVLWQEYFQASQNPLSTSISLLSLRIN